MKTNNFNRQQLRSNLDTNKQMLIKSFIVMNMTTQNITLKDFLNELEKSVIEYALSLSRNNQREAAELLSLKPSSLSEKLKRFDIIRSGEKSPDIKQRQAFSDIFSFLTQIPDSSDR